MRGRDLETEVRLSFDQAGNGAEVRSPVPKAERCTTCRGSGAKPGTSQVCPRCGGRGIDAESQGFFSISQPCPQCGGARPDHRGPLPDLRRLGPDRAAQALPGEGPGGRPRRQPRIRVAGKGEDGPRGGPPGDLYVVTRVPPSPVFKQRDDGNLEVTVPITIAEAIGARRWRSRRSRHEADPGPRRDTARNGPAAARRGAARAGRTRARRHPLPARDRDPARADREQRRRWTCSREAERPRPARAPAARCVRSSRAQGRRRTRWRAGRGAREPRRRRRASTSAEACS